MKVLQVLPSLDSGGVERGTVDLARALVGAGHQSHVLSAGGRMVSRLENHGSLHTQWNLGKKSSFTLRHVGPLRRWLMDQRFDIVHLRSRMPAWIVWLAWRRMDPTTRPRLVTTVHGLHSVSRYSEIVTCGERVIVVSESVRRYVLESYPRCDAAKLRLVYRGINPLEFPRGHRPRDEWLSQWYRDFPQLLDARVVTIAGRLTRLKGHHDFLALIRSLRETDPSIQGLVVGGEDPKRQAYARELYAAVKNQGLDEAVVFTGHRNDLRDIYAVSDVVVSLTTQPESFGRTVLEPLAEGRPVVGYEQGGVAEILEALYPCGAVAVNDLDAVREQVHAILRGDTPPPKENDRFLLDTMAAETLAVYEELLSSPARSSNPETPRAQDRTS